MMLTVRQMTAMGILVLLVVSGAGCKTIKRIVDPLDILGLQQQSAAQQLYDEHKEALRQKKEQLTQRQREYQQRLQEHEKARRALLEQRAAQARRR